MSAKKNTKTAQAPKAKAAKAPKAAKKPAKAKGDAKPKRTSALAAANVLANVGEPMNTKQMPTKRMIGAMAAKALWMSPGDATPWATLYSAILRNLNEKGKEARFVKTERGKITVKK
ncbi:MAG: hypothetical protein WD176_08220 [Pirellulales bacterium]